MIRILAVGKKTDRDLVEAIYSYTKRLRGLFELEWLTIPYSAKSGLEARQDETEQLLKHIRPTDKVILLDERGRQYTSPEFSDLLVDFINVTIVIGGAYGVDDRLRQRADVMMSLSKLVFPHQLVRLLLVEQIYRAQCIYNNHPYHHE